MSDYTPTTEEVRDHNNWLGEEFDRWLAEVKAEAWEEGCQSGWERQWQTDDEITFNPYRQQTQ